MRPDGIRVIRVIKCVAAMTHKVSISHHLYKVKRRSNHHSDYFHLSLIQPSMTCVMNVPSAHANIGPIKNTDDRQQEKRA